jgi:hypothetical protein
MGDITFFLAIVLAASAVHKLVERERLATATAQLLRLPAALGTVISLAVAALEALAAIALVIPDSRAIGALLAATIWGAYAIALASRYGQSLDCGCNFGARAKPVDTFMVARAAGLSALALVSYFVVPGGFTILSPFVALGGFALYLALGEITSIIIPNRRHTR